MTHIAHHQLITLALMKPRTSELESGSWSSLLVPWICLELLFCRPGPEMAPGGNVELLVLRRFREAQFKLQVIDSREDLLTRSATDGTARLSSLALSSTPLPIFSDWYTHASLDSQIPTGRHFPSLPAWPAGI